MATLVKEKHKQKKKSKDKQPRIKPIENVIETPDIREESPENPTITSAVEEILHPIADLEIPSTSAGETENNEDVAGNVSAILSPSLETSHSEICAQTCDNNESEYIECESTISTYETETNFKDLTGKLKRMAIPQLNTELTEKRKKELENPDAYLTARESDTQANDSKDVQVEIGHMSTLSEQAIQNHMETETEETCSLQATETSEVAEPSAPMLIEDIPQAPACSEQTEVVVQYVKPKTKCMPLEDAMRLFGGKEIAEVQALSEREEAIVEAGPLSGPDHPLVDLLSTFRSALIAVERERNELFYKVNEEERIRNELWKIERLSINLSEPCPCGARVYFKGSYDYAVLLRDKLPVAKMRLESLLRDIQDSYCHYQHEALLAHCQIEELISETIVGNKPDIREALSLILQALRLSDTAPAALSSALQRWASALAAALVDARDLRQLLFLIHHLFRQTHSVKWASSFIRLRVEDSVSAARMIGLLEILLARPKPQLDTALECTEETEEVWEEVDKHGGGGAVSEGTLRERDLLALLYAFPLQELVARLLLFTHADIRQARVESWGGESGAGGALRACYGVRTLLHALHRATAVHAKYHRLRKAMRSVATSALVGLAGLHLCSRDYYKEEHKAKITAELEACFTAGLAMFGTEELCSLPATLLAEDTAMDYCVTLAMSLHDKSPKRIESLSVDMAVLPCDARVGVVTHAAMHRTQHHHLARTVLDFLFATCMRRKSAQCKGACVVAAREALPRLLAAHPYLYAIALHTLAELHQTEPVEPWAVTVLSVGAWRPQPSELRALLDDWLVRCEHLIQHLLLNLDYTPHTGLSLDTQLSLGSWLCTWNNGGEARWRVLRRLRTHRTEWGGDLEAPPPDPPPDHADIFATAYALLSTSWGHCIPLVCAEGVQAAARVCAWRAREAVCCVAPLMRVMALSPESVSLTPQFSSVLSSLLASGPTLVQRALGRGGETGLEMLLRVLLEQLQNHQQCPGVFSAWAHALWGKNIASGGQGMQLLDVAAIATRDWPQLDAHAALLIQEENGKEQINNAVKFSYLAPLLCESILRAWQASSALGHHAPLLQALHAQREGKLRIHVDKALQQIEATIGSEELTIYRCATAALAAPLHHPSHLTLWRLFMHLYLERPPGHMPDSVLPVGPMFFSGIIKYRTLGQIKKRLYDAATHHCMEVGKIKSEQHIAASESIKNNTIEESPISVEESLFPSLTIVDLTGESGEFDSGSEEEVKDNAGSKEDKPESLKKKQRDLVNYHIGAEKMMREYLRLMEEGEKVRALQHHVDIARFIPEQALEAGWQAALAHSSPQTPTDEDSPVTTKSPVMTPPPPPVSPFKMAIDAILNIKDDSQKRRREINIISPIEDMNFKDSRTLFSIVDKHMKDIENLAQEWSKDVSQISVLDGKLWDLVSVLRVRRSLPPVRRQCPNKCKPIIIIIPQQEWCISTSAENGIRENRGRWVCSVRRMSRARPHAARVAAALLALASRIADGATAALLAERLWRGTAAADACSLARHALNDTMRSLAEKWISRDGPAVVELVGRWSRSSQSPAQMAQVGALVAPRLLPPHHWPLVYITVLKAPLPEHVLFSCLSKFEMSKWSSEAPASLRGEILGALCVAAQRWGAAPSPQQAVALELLGVHSAALLHAAHLPPHLQRLNRAAHARALPPHHLAHLLPAATRCAPAVPYDQLGHLLRDLGASWWEVRKRLPSGEECAPYSLYAPHLAQLFRVLLRAFVRAAVELSYEPVRVGRCAWSGVLDSFGAWVTPHAKIPPLLPYSVDDDNELYTSMLEQFVETIQQLMEDCPGSEESLLQAAWEWCVCTCAGARGNAHSAALMSHMARLPWRQHQWCYAPVLNTVMQMSAIDDREIQRWCCETWRDIRAETWIRGEEGDPTPATLMKLLYLFTGSTMPHLPETIDEAARLPWDLLPEHAVEQGLDYFFSLHHTSGKAYHELPQFHVALHACGLRVSANPVRCAGGAGGAGRRGVRGAVLSRAVRAGAAPVRLRHVPADTATLLHTIALLAPHIENSEGELEDLLSRAIIIMAMEPAAAAALPVWEQWICNSNAVLCRAVLSAVNTVTVLPYFATLADLAAKQHLRLPVSSGWDEVRSRWAACPWRKPQALMSCGRLHAAYGCALVTDLEDGHMHGMIRIVEAFTERQFDFIEEEAMIAVWICYLVRTSVECTESSSIVCASTCEPLMSRWAEPARRSLLRVVTLQPDNDRPTAGHRLLCRLAQCVLSPSESATRAYESACASMGTQYSDVADWGAAPTSITLPRLATRLYPKYSVYFSKELHETAGI